MVEEEKPLPVWCLEDFNFDSYAHAVLYPIFRTTVCEFILKFKRIISATSSLTRELKYASGLFLRLTLGVDPSGPSAANQMVRGQADLALMGFLLEHGAFFWYPSAAARRDKAAEKRQLDEFVRTLQRVYKAGVRYDVVALVRIDFTAFRFELFFFASKCSGKIGVLQFDVN
jgi:hypothetical protein